MTAGIRHYRPQSAGARPCFTRAGLAGLTNAYAAPAAPVKLARQPGQPARRSLARLPSGPPPPTMTLAVSQRAGKRRP